MLSKISFHIHFKDGSHDSVDDHPTDGILGSGPGSCVVFTMILSGLRLPQPVTILTLLISELNVETHKAHRDLSWEYKLDILLNMIACEHAHLFMSVKFLIYL